MGGFLDGLFQLLVAKAADETIEVYSRVDLNDPNFGLNPGAKIQVIWSVIDGFYTVERVLGRNKFKVREPIPVTTITGFVRVVHNPFPRYGKDISTSRAPRGRLPASTLNPLVVGDSIKTVVSDAVVTAVDGPWATVKLNYYGTKHRVSAIGLEQTIDPNGNVTAEFGPTPDFMSQ